MLNNKKGNIAVIAVLGVIIIIIVVAWLVSIAARDCDRDLECPGEMYCGSDFRCHKPAVLEKTEVHNDFHLTYAAVIIGVAIVIAAFILRYGRKEDAGKEDDGQKGSYYQPSQPSQPQHSRIMEQPQAYPHQQVSQREVQQENQQQETFEQAYPRQHDYSKDKNSPHKQIGRFGSHTDIPRGNNPDDCMPKKG
ncbi:hypothetical protein GF351_03950 [Candidatus Woesearchaeota archaeon]|nr:hypothetical protein [Candidatus Woesearchaeota archaeon]